MPPDNGIQPPDSGPQLMPQPLARVRALVTLSFWAEDARVVAPGEPPYIGRDAIRQMLVDGLATPGFSLTWETTGIVVAPSGTFAYSFGTNAFTVPSPDGALVTLEGQGVVVWRKHEDGRWRCVVDIWNARGDSR